MELRHYATLVWRWLWLIALGAVVAGLAAFLVSRQMAPVYQASATLLVDQSTKASTDYNTIITSERRSLTYAEWMKKQTVLEGVIGQLGLPLTAKKLAKMVAVRYVRDTQLLELTVEDSSAARAAAIANTLPDVFTQQSQLMQTRRFADSKAALVDQLQKLQDEIDRTQGTLKTEQEAGGDADAVARLQADLRELQNNYTTLFKSLGDVRLEEARNVDTVYVIQRAVEPIEPIRPRPLRNTALAAVIGAMLALGVMMLIEYLDDVLKNPDIVKQELGLATLGAIPVMERAKGKESDLVTLEDDRGAATEAFRVLRTNLQFASVDRELKSLLVTSPSPDEGKSRTAANLAVALAQAGMRVVLVDADLHRPRQHRIMKLANNVGLTNALLEDQPRAAGMLRETAVPGLRVLTAGPLPPNAAELLGSARMAVLLANLKAESDMVVLDSPPVTALSDSAILASQSDGVLLVLDAQKTRREITVHAMESLGQVQARVVGVVLNRMLTRRGSYYYYHYYSHYDSPKNGKRGKGRAGTWTRRKRGEAKQETPSIAARS